MFNKISSMLGKAMNIGSDLMNTLRPLFAPAYLGQKVVLKYEVFIP